MMAPRFNGIPVETPKAPRFAGGIPVNPQAQPWAKAGEVSRDFFTPTAQGKYDSALTNIRTKYYPQMSDEQWGEYSKAAMSPSSGGDLFQNAFSFGLADEAGATAGAMGHIFDGKFGDAWQDFKQLEDAKLALGKEQAGGWAMPIELAGAVFSGGPAGMLQTATTKAPLLTRALTTADQAAGQAFMYGFGTNEGDLAERGGAGLLSAAVAAPLGGAATVLGNTVSKAVANRAQTKATNAAIKGAPKGADLGALGGQMFKKVDASGAAVKPQVFGQLAMDIARKAKADRINVKLDPKATGAMEEMLRMANEAMKAGKPLTLSELHTMRQIAQKAAISVEGRDAMFADRIVDGIDDLIQKLKPADMANGGPQTGNLLMEAISTWGRAKRVSVIEEAMFKAQNQASGLENGLRTQFRAILQNPAKRNQFTEVELEAIKKVANGTGVSNITRLLGMFGFDFGGSGRNMVGGTVGALLGGLPGVIAGSAARKGSELLTRGAADRASRIIATPNIPQLPMLPGISSVEKMLGRGAILPSTQLPQL